MRLFKPRSITRFFVVGCVNTLIGLSAFPILFLVLHGFFDIGVLLAASYFICTLIAFILHRTITFRSEGAAHREAIRYALLSALTYGINLILLKVSLAVFPHHPVILQSLLAVMFQLGNYIAMHRLIFYAPSTQSEGLK